MLALGIPGDVVTAIMIGAFVAQGIKPGPLLFTQNIKDVYLIYIGLILSVIALFVIGIFSIRYIVKIVSIKKSILFPCVFVLCVVGTYAARGNLFDCLIMIIFGLFGYFLRRNKFQIAPFIIAYILGPEVELNYRLALRISNMNYLTFFQKPISLFFISATLLFIAFSMFKEQISRTLRFKGSKNQ
jgi:putative tricarboxylic transport membrane protein